MFPSNFIQLENGPKKLVKQKNKNRWPYANIKIYLMQWSSLVCVTGTYMHPLHPMVTVKWVEKQNTLMHYDKYARQNSGF